MSATPSNVPPSSPSVSPSPAHGFELAEQPLGAGFVLVVLLDHEGAAAFLAHRKRVLWDVTVVEC